MTTDRSKKCRCGRRRQPTSTTCRVCYLRRTARDRATWRSGDLEAERARMSSAGYLTPKEAASMFGVAVTWAYEAIRSGGVAVRAGALVVGRGEPAKYLQRESWVGWAEAKRQRALSRIGHGASTVRRVR